MIVTPDGLPLTYDVPAGNTADSTILGDFLKRIERLYGRAERVWVMDRGIPTEEALSAMRESDMPVRRISHGSTAGRCSGANAGSNKPAKLPAGQVLRLVQGL